MTFCRGTIALLLFVGSLPLWSQIAQDKATGNTGAKAVEENLELATMGEVRVWNGRRGAFRIYKTSDGTEGSVAYAEFHSLHDAKRQIKEWLRLAQKVKGKEQKKNRDGAVVGDRIVAMAQNMKSGREEFLIIGRNNLDVYLVQSSSLSVGIQVEHMIAPE